MSKGGRTSTTWAGSSWRHGETKTIRIPAALADEIMNYARALDSSIAVSQGNMQEVILNAIAAYIEIKKRDRQPNQFNKELDIKTRSWDELRKFAAMVKDDPQKLGIND